MHRTTFAVILLPLSLMAMTTSDAHAQTDRNAPAAQQITKAGSQASTTGPSDYFTGRVRIDMLWPIAFKDVDAFAGEKIAHRRIHVLVRSTDVVTAMLKHRRQGRHCRSGHTDQMNTRHYSTAASRMRTTGDGSVTTSARTPNGSVHVAPAV